MNSEIFYISSERFDLIYQLSIDKPSWEVVGILIEGTPISPEEFEFVIKKTRLNGGGKR